MLGCLLIPPTSDFLFLVNIHKNVAFFFFFWYSFTLQTWHIFSKLFQISLICACRQGGNYTRASKSSGKTFVGG